MYFDTSVDGSSWSNLHSFANPFAITSVKIALAAGTYQTEGSTTSALFDNLNILSATSSGTITYDANGNMTSEGGKCYEYNEANKLKKVTQCSDNQTIAEYVYDYNGIRLIKKNYTNGTLANTVISWSKSFETKDIVGGSIETTNYFFANGALVAMKKPDNSMRYFHSDHLGSTTVITNQSGDLVEETAFGPWGEAMEGGTESKYQFTGQEKDAETGLNYMNARYYSADMKRFTQPDSLVQNVYDPQMLNRYAYARNNPLKYTDPSGHAVNCGPTGCFSSNTVLNKPKPQQKPQTYQQFINNIPKLPASAPQNQPTRQPSGNNGGGNSGSSNNQSSNNNQGNIGQAAESVLGNKTSSSPSSTVQPKGLETFRINSAGGCGAGNLGLAGYGSISGCIVNTKEREIGWLITISGGGTTGAASGVGITPLISTANNMEQLKGPGVFAGWSSVVVGADVSWDPKNPNIRTGTLSGPGPDVTVLGVPIPFEAHGGGDYSFGGTIFKY